MIEVLGLDLSLTASGIACAAGPRTFKPFTKGVQRLADVRICVDAELETHKDVVAIIEGYSFGSRNGGERLGELGGVIRLLLWSHDTPFVEIPPNTLKKYATGKGVATKPDMRMAMFKRAGIDEADDNAVDAWWLRQMGLSHYAPSHPDCVPMPASHVEALDKIDWPEVNV